MLRNISLFAGCGGIDLGLKWAGIETIAAVELKEYAAQSLRANSPKTYVFGPPYSDGDVRNITATMIREATNYYGEIDLLSGGPPCQPFSIAAGQRFGKDDERYKRLGNENKEFGDLLPEYVRLVQELQPRVFLLENVEGLLAWNEGEYLRVSLAPLLDEYTISAPKIIDAADYGVPQRRKRLILIGTRVTNKSPELPPATNGEDSLFLHPYTTVLQALNGIIEGMENHEIRQHKPETIARYERLNYGERDKKGRVDRLHPHQPSKTIIAGGDKGGGRSHLHPILPRTLSPRECARLQTFPDDYIFLGSTARQFTQIGNAVPPLLAYKIGRYIVEELLNNDVPGVDLSTLQHPIFKNL